MKTIKLLPLLSTVLLTSCSLVTPSGPSIDPIHGGDEPGEDYGFVPDGYSLFFEDEFNGDSLSKDNWEVMYGDGSLYNVYRWGNNEEQFYKEENIVVSDGALHIIAKKESTHTERKDFEYTSARIRSQGKVTTTFGYIESRIKLPLGTGMWPAFWMLPESNYQGRWWPVSGEIDIMEAKGRLPLEAAATVHTASPSGHAMRGKTYNFKQNDDISNYHCYGVLWEEELLEFYIDGQCYFSCPSSSYQHGNTLYSDQSKSAPFDAPFHILLNLAVGGNYDGGRLPEDSFEQAEMAVDYVRIFHKN